MSLVAPILAPEPQLQHRLRPSPTSIVSTGCDDVENLLKDRITELEQENNVLRGLLYPPFGPFSELLRLTRKQHTVLAYLLARSPSYVPQSALTALFPASRDPSFARNLISRLRAKVLRHGIAIEGLYDHGYRLSLAAAARLRLLREAA